MATARERMNGGHMSAYDAKGVEGGYSTVAATGSAIGDAALVSSMGSNCVVTAADGTKGVAVNGEIGDSYWLFNNSGSNLKVYPESTAAICVVGTGLGSAGAALTVATYKTVILKKITATQWLAVTSA